MVVWRPNEVFDARNSPSQTPSYRGACPGLHARFRGGGATTLGVLQHPRWRLGIATLSPGEPWLEGYLLGESGASRRKRLCFCNALKSQPILEFTGKTALGGQVFLVDVKETKLVH